MCKNPAYTDLPFQKLETIITNFMLDQLEDQYQFDWDEMETKFPPTSLSVQIKQQKGNFKVKIKLILDNKIPEIHNSKTLLNIFQVYCIIKNNESKSSYLKFIKGKATKKECQKIQTTLQDINDFFESIKRVIKTCFKLKKEKLNKNYAEVKILTSEEEHNLEILTIARLLFKIFIKKITNDLLNNTHQCDLSKFKYWNKFIQVFQLQFEQLRLIENSFQPLASKNIYLVNKQKSEQFKAYLRNSFLKNIKSKKKLLWNYHKFIGRQLSLTDTLEVLELIYKLKEDINLEKPNKKISYSKNDQKQQQLQHKFLNKKQKEMNQDQIQQSNQQQSFKQLFDKKEQFSFYDDFNYLNLIQQQPQNNTPVFSEEFQRIIQDCQINTSCNQAPKYDEFFQSIQYKYLLEEIYENLFQYPSLN